MKAILEKSIIQKVNIQLDGLEIANLFWDLCQDEQAKFFNHLSKQDGFVFQLQAVTDSSQLTSGGRYAMERIGEYAPKIER